MTLTIDGRVLVVLTAVSAVSVLVFGLAPAVHLLRLDINQIIKDSGRTADAGIPARRWTTAFLAVEFALTLVLLTLVVTGIRQTRATQRAEFPFDAFPILSMWITVSGQPYATPESRDAFTDRLVASFAAVPGVSSVSVASALPRVGGPSMKLEIAGEPPPHPTLRFPRRPSSMSVRSISRHCAPRSRGDEPSPRSTARGSPLRSSISVW